MRGRAARRNTAWPGALCVSSPSAPYYGGRVRFPSIEHSLLNGTCLSFFTNSSPNGEGWGDGIISLWPVNRQGCLLPVGRPWNAPEQEQGSHRPCEVRETVNLVLPGGCELKTGPSKRPQGPQISFLVPVLRQDKMDQRPEGKQDGSLQPAKFYPSARFSVGAGSTGGFRCSQSMPGPCALTIVSVSGPAEVREAPAAQLEGGLMALPQGSALPQRQGRVLRTPIGDEAVLLASVGTGRGSALLSQLGRHSRSTHDEAPSRDPH